MRYCLIRHESEVLTDYTNLWVGVRAGSQPAVDIFKLPEIIVRGSATEILVPGALQDFDLGKACELIKMLGTRLSLGGVLTVCGSDFDSVINYTASGYLKYEQASPKLFTQYCHPITNMIQAFENAGLKLVNKRLNGTEYTITGVR